MRHILCLLPLTFLLACSKVDTQVVSLSSTSPNVVPNSVFSSSMPNAYVISPSGYKVRHGISYHASAVTTSPSSFKTRTAPTAYMPGTPD